MPLIKRLLSHGLSQALRRGKSVLLLGPRQTGKTTLVQDYPADWYITLLIAKTRRQYEADPDRLIREVEALNQKNGKPPVVIIDEVQKVPPLLDAIQYLIDEGHGQFILTGSSARKLRHGKHVNFLPGRLIQLRLDPLTLGELEEPLPEIEQLLCYGSLPAITQESDLSLREQELEAYVDLYLEEEVRAEALVRDLGSFENFLRLAAMESGNIVNLDKVSQDLGVSRSTISSYYQVLEDCLIAERIEPYTESLSRKKLTKSPKYLLFDLGLRRLAAEEVAKLPQVYLGALFEQFVGLELIHWSRLQEEKVHIHFWRDAAGPEVDWIVRCGDRLLPIEVKWTDSPSFRDAKHLGLFLGEYPKATQGFVVCCADRPQLLGEGIEAIPWKDLPQRLDDWQSES